MITSKIWERYHLTKLGWVADYTYKYLMGKKPAKLLTRQYGSMEEVDFNYFKDIWTGTDLLELEIYLALYPHPDKSNNDFSNYHKVDIFLNN
ncbi:MAG: hypothetical protein ACPGJS_22735 [Flammeovirgaceae bacterium]